MSALALGCGQSTDDASIAVPRQTVGEVVENSIERLIYVPAYSYAVDHAGRIPLTTILTVHNTSRRPVTIESVDYYDSRGVLAERKLAEPRALGALETIEFEIAAGTATSGAGANFVVGWDGPPHADPPLAEALMIGHLGTGRLTFASRGVEVAVPGERQQR